MLVRSIASRVRLLRSGSKPLRHGAAPGDRRARLRQRAAPAALVLCLALGGCGDDPGDPQQTVRDFAKATSTRDVEAICGRLLTRDFLERTTGGVGEGAERACRGQLRGARVVKTRVLRIEDSEVDGDRARVRVLLATEGQRRPRTFRLVDEDGEWKIAGAVGG